MGSGYLPHYAKIPIRFPVASRLRVDPLEGGLGGLIFREEAVVPPYWKDYDRLPDGGPEMWPRRFDVSRWGILLARQAGRDVGGAAVAFRCADLDMLEGRTDLAILWDLRVLPELRRTGIGTQLINYAAQWARRRGCRQLKVETQNVNVPACRFYARSGCLLGGVHRFAYASTQEVAHEVMLLWYRDLLAS
jgi:GNAT superfamily N-acetyltransferase